MYDEKISKIRGLLNSREFGAHLFGSIRLGGLEARALSETGEIPEELKRLRNESNEIYLSWCLSKAERAIAETNYHRARCELQVIGLFSHNIMKIRIPAKAYELLKQLPDKFNLEKLYARLETTQ